MRIVETIRAPAQEIMDKDERLLQELTDEPILHLYEWASPSFTYGYFIDIEKFIDLSKAKEEGIDSARRPTGGGIIFHLWDQAFSFLLPASHPACKATTLENYRFVNEAVLKAIEHFLQRSGRLGLIAEDVDVPDLSMTKFCMARPTKYDVMLGGKKVAGASQRKRTSGYLHQGTISLIPPDENLLGRLLLHPQVTQSIARYSMALVQGGQDFGCAKELIKGLLKDALHEACSSAAPSTVLAK